MEDNRNRDRVLRMGAAATIGAVIAGVGFAVYNYYSKKHPEPDHSYQPTPTNSAHQSRRSSSSSYACPICFEEMTSSQKILPCHHSFHVKCIQEWISHSNTCPMCRLTVNL